MIRIVLFKIEPEFVEIIFQLMMNIWKFYLKKKFKVKSFKTNLSLSDEKNYSIAYVIIEKK